MNYHIQILYNTVYVQYKYTCILNAKYTRCSQNFLVNLLLLRIPFTIQNSTVGIPIYRRHRRLLWRAAGARNAERCTPKRRGLERSLDRPSGVPQVCVRLRSRRKRRPQRYMHRVQQEPRRLENGWPMRSCATITSVSVLRCARAQLSPQAGPCSGRHLSFGSLYLLLIMIKKFYRPNLQIWFY